RDVVEHGTALGFGGGAGIDQHGLTRVMADVAVLGEGADDEGLDGHGEGSGESARGLNRQPAAALAPGDERPSPRRVALGGRARGGLLRLPELAAVRAAALALDAPALPRADARDAGRAAGLLPPLAVVGGRAEGRPAARRRAMADVVRAEAAHRGRARGEGPRAVRDLALRLVQSAA